MSNLNKKLVAGVLAGTLVIGNTAGIKMPDVQAKSVEAKYEKDENIYGILKANGNLDEMYVVNQFEVKKAGSKETFITRAITSTESFLGNSKFVTT
ncbi:MAG: hypothetical protein K6A30_08605 [Lachnospiraceae bacterium]|nr:hypothetical protein [Lachnospiraceae bacterium]